MDSTGYHYLITTEDGVSGGIRYWRSKTEFSKDLPVGKTFECFSFVDGWIKCRMTASDIELCRGDFIHTLAFLKSQGYAKLIKSLFANL